MATKTKTETNGAHRSSITLFDNPVTSVIRWMGKDEFTYAETVQALKDAKCSPMPAEATIRIQLSAGKKGTRGEPAKITGEQQKFLRGSAKKVEA